MAQCYQLKDNPRLSSSIVSRTELMSAVLYSQYSPEALSGDLQQSAKDHLNRVEASMQRLNSWSAKNHISSSPTDIRKALSNSEHPDHCHRHRAIRDFYSYHLSVFFIHCPWLPLFARNQAPIAGDETILQLKEQSIAACLHSAFSTIELSNYLLDSGSKMIR